jgi:tRNA dimethylallyltransferase
VPVLVGGTGFFLKALTDPLFVEPELSADRREELRRYLEPKSDQELHEWLQRLDPEAARRHGERRDRQRMTRALEVVLLTGRTLGWWHQHAQPVGHAIRPLSFLLELPREELYGRINARVEEMVERGLVEEVRELVAAGFDERAPGLKTTGYLELLPYLGGEIDLPTAVDAIQRASRRYARRQSTWFRHQLPADTIRLDAREPLEQLVRRVTRQWEVGSADRH